MDCGLGSTGKSKEAQGENRGETGQATIAA